MDTWVGLWRDPGRRAWLTLTPTLTSTLTLTLMLTFVTLYPNPVPYPDDNPVPYHQVEECTYSPTFFHSRKLPYISGFPPLELVACIVQAEQSHVLYG